MLQLRNIHKVYSDDPLKRNILNGLDFTINAGDFISIKGASGVGKSTLLNIIALLDDISDGEYYINGNKIIYEHTDVLNEIRRTTFGFIFQNYNLLDNLSVRDNILLPLYYRQGNFRNSQHKLLSLCSILNIEFFLNSYPKTLSGGEKQRVAIARALINNPSYILADEPTGALDTTSAREFMKLLTYINESGTGIILVTHDDKISKYAQKNYCLNNGMIMTL
ncbi:ABC transporter ATP-binding protein [Salmonella enterica]|nr:ABC transporter ATP-binding protein [Salmonella enterica]EFO5648732.1 ABC transporter ATP-binding protein [Salmonella enterica subsp. enterica serovar Miami]EAT1014597.1 ABC transporter ATP-binding protein [Salmonella enterica]EBB2055429.1 ABC transporter ATP-binding protein [Salmonella enterica]EBN0646557.1 ABC transporter ATP-binding protein [Salmonella enterica]